MTPLAVGQPVWIDAREMATVIRPPSRVLDYAVVRYGDGHEQRIHRTRVEARRCAGCLGPLRRTEDGMWCCPKCEMLEFL